MTDNALITTPFGATSTAREVLDGVDLAGRRAIVTGGASGIGWETARALAASGAEVTLAARETGAAQTAARQLTDATGNPRVLVATLDLASRQSVAEFAAAWRGPLHILVNNAGIMATPELRTPEGWELQFATNHLGHFALATGLHAALAAAQGARVVSVSSVGHINGDVLFDDPHFQHHPYDPWAAYAQSKTANVLFAVEAARRWAADGIAVNALNPGRIPGTGLARHMSGGLESAPASFEANSTDVSWKNTEQGAATSVLLAGSPLVAGVTGRYFEDCQEADRHRPGVRRGIGEHALDPDRAARLWRLSTSLLAV
ncbi:SDR family NAD(P)-dependent oxidoreductase [Streptomyces sp. NPDC055692]|uniref:SDR family NAD(P)-dependent oxidoreductase n=1 Tax=Streptomyces sp. NPDC055692 TaxID=3155683 RepID=UPI0034305768